MILLKLILLPIVVVVFFILFLLKEDDLVLKAHVEGEGTFLLLNDFGKLSQRNGNCRRVVFTIILLVPL